MVVPASDRFSPWLLPNRTAAQTTTRRRHNGEGGSAEHIAGLEFHDPGDDLCRAAECHSQRNDRGSPATGNRPALMRLKEPS
jgi:hypothetical protein